MAERKGDTKSTLLDELESIKGLLIEDGEFDEDDIPILQEVIESIEPADPDRPRQPSLFTRDTRPPQPTRAEGENPFLPAHIRARLQGNQPPPLLSESELDETGQRNQFQTRHTHPTPSHSNVAEPKSSYGSGSNSGTSNHGTANSGLSTPGKRSDLIEAVIAELRPSLEMRLRAHLEPLSQDVLLELLTAGDDDESGDFDES